jgi:hypothetical protein
MWRRVDLYIGTNISEEAAVVFMFTSTQKMEAAGSSEILVRVYQTTRRHISEDSSVHSRRRENLKLRFTSQFLHVRSCQ